MKLVVLVGCLLAACDDGSLRAFEPRVLALGGAGGAGGAGGMTSAPEAGKSTAPSLPLLIDDFEDGDPRAKEPLGWWYPVNDGKGTQGFGIEPASLAPTGVYALRTHGSGFHDWGAAVGVDLLGNAGPLDLRSGHELCFIARIEAASSTSMQVHLLSAAQHYIRDVSLSETWTRYCLALTDFRSLNQEALVPTQLIALQYFFPPTEPFAFWLDDVEVMP
ncbi:MAG TPA: hypothetical protein VHP33_18840 [Polyangiaceae bacterium]|nr:hypothetical protein [Polyangiaceae bacterium]